MQHHHGVYGQLRSAILWVQGDFAVRLPKLLWRLQLHAHVRPNVPVILLVQWDNMRVEQIAAAATAATAAQSTKPTVASSANAAKPITSAEATAQPATSQPSAQPSASQSTN
jgi:hypothetical protein